MLTVALLLLWSQSWVLGEVTPPRYQADPPSYQADPSSYQADLHSYQADQPVLPTYTAGLQNDQVDLHSRQTGQLNFQSGAPGERAGELAVRCLVEQVVQLELGPRMFTWPQEEGAGLSNSATQYRYRWVNQNPHSCSFLLDFHRC